MWDLESLHQSAFVAGLKQAAEQRARLIQLAPLLDDTSLHAAPSTPEEAWEWLYASFIEAIDSRRERFQAYTDRQLGEGVAWSAVTPEERRQAKSREEPPPFDGGPLIDNAEVVLELFPDHPIAEHALLLSTIGVHHRYGSKREVGDTWLRRFDAISDPQLATVALMDLVETSGWHRLEPEVLDAMLAFDGLDPVDEVRVLNAVAVHAAKQHDVARGVAVEARLRPALIAYCQVSREDQCTRNQAQLRDLTARLVAADGIEPRTWQEALTAEAWRCETTGATHSGVAKATATWDGLAWSWSAWNRETSATQCLGRVATTHPSPVEPVEVSVTYDHDAR